MAKGRKFKALRRRYCEAGQAQLIRGSLFVVWAFESSRRSTVKTNLIAALSDVSRSEQPDLIVVPDEIVARAGTYLELSKIGQANSQHRAQLRAQHGQDLDALIPEPAEIFDLGENALLALYVWIDSWLRQAGSRLADPVAYLPPNQVFGRVV